MRKSRKFGLRDEGATTVEYALVLAILAIAVAAAVSLLVTPLGSLFQGPTDAIIQALNPGG